MRQVQSGERERERGQPEETGLASATGTGQSRVNSDSQRTPDIMMSLKIVTILLAASVLLTEVNV